MIKILCFVIFAFSVTPILASTYHQQSQISSACNTKMVNMHYLLDRHHVELKILMPYSNVLFAKRGCCSWHKGVCGCSGGRAACCDGTLSPSCGC